ncbi:hypothetical protein [Microbacterium sp. EF45047]|uniref:hypothetical protein n=1 Tax=Microbacterium sp. EF45047 TaxID=2809708 RepID=UPI00234A6919|nr:hypothetical protein [Microbacterium sp. EF45047]WCM56478.1 hypothetical protein JRG78_04610 [Microbacterium sp. EF45047]
MSATALAHAPAADRRPRVRICTGQVLLSVLFALCAMIAASTAFADDPFEPAAVVLIASFGCLAAVLGAAIVWSLPAAPRLWWALWALPGFFVRHVAALGTWVPDAVFAVAATAGVLLAKPARARPARD